MGTSEIPCLHLYKSISHMFFSFVWMWRIKNNKKKFNDQNQNKIKSINENIWVWNLHSFVVSAALFLSQTLNMEDGNRVDFYLRIRNKSKTKWMYERLKWKERRSQSREEKKEVNEKEVINKEME